MIFANYGSGGYEILNHCKWNGLHSADLVFPWFMWIMGACIPLSLISSFKKNITNLGIVRNIVEVSINKLNLLFIMLYRNNLCVFLKIPLNFVEILDKII